ncbi:MAG TPA: helix-turn-helix domain-containing protein [Thermodesulfobacteriota bacterium]|nr:helix-turn-helix domain-containing protein [Thermodesulfobacteriota bacterium]
MANVAASGAVTDEGLLLAAREIFARKGYGGTSVREIVAAAGVTKPGSAKPEGRTRPEARERTMRRLILFSSFLVVVLFVAHYGSTQERQQIHPPVITHAYATDKGPNGTVWKIYIEAEDAGGDMNYVLVVVDQIGQGRYPADRVLLDPRHRSHLKAFLQWNTLRAEGLREGTHITVTVSIVDKAGDSSNEVIFPFTFVSGASAQQDAPTPFDEMNIPRIGYIGVSLVNPDRY